MIISPDELKTITSAKCANIYDYLGMHKCQGGVVARCYLPDAKNCVLVNARTGEKFPMSKLDESGFFELFLKGKRSTFKHWFEVEDYRGGTRKVFRLHLLFQILMFTLSARQTTEKFTTSLVAT